LLLWVSKIIYMTSAPTFRKINAGLYGTGIKRIAVGSTTWNAETDEVEVVIDCMDGYWYEREMQADGDFTDYCGESHRTLAAAKQAIR
jgi:hypothetical protein